MTPGTRFHLYADAGAWWVGVVVLPDWVCVQIVPCLGAGWKRRKRGPRTGDLVLYR